ncbi:MAG TPA: glycosyltransferase [Nitrospirales bacterium]|nr:glycosyltransferase [Nitrospirales bacterium]
MDVLKRNVEILRHQDQVLAAKILEISGGTLSIQPARSGMPTALVNSRYIHSAYDPVLEAEGWAKERMKDCQPGETIIVLGVGLLYHVQALRQVLSHDHIIMVAVPDLSEFVDCVSVRSLVGWGEQVMWLTGSMADMAVRVTQNAKRVRILSYEPATNVHHDAYEDFRLQLRDHLAQQLSGVLHIMVIGPIYGGSLPVARYVVNALEALGHRVSWIDHSPHYAGYQNLEMIRDHRLRLTVQQRMSETLAVISLAHVAEDPPDLVLALSQAPLTMAVLEQMRRKRVLTAMWFVENFRHLTYWQQMVTGYDFWFVMQQAACLDAFRKAGASQVSYLPLAAEPAMHQPMTLTLQEREEFGADVSFLGAGYWNRRQILPSLVGHGWTFKLWGNEWDTPGALEAVLQRGGARIDTPTSVKIFNATSVNINLHSYTGEGFDLEGDGVNPRTFELASCGAFQVVDARTLLPALFDETMMAIINSPDQLLSTVQSYVHEPARRMAMAESSRKRVLEAHTYVHRMKTLLGAVGMASPDRLGAILQGERHAESLMNRSGESPELIPMLKQFPQANRVELVDVAKNIRKKGPEGKLNREELLILMMDEYRQEKRDFL